MARTLVYDFYLFFGPFDHLIQEAHSIFTFWWTVSSRFRLYTFQTSIKFEPYHLPIAMFIEVNCQLCYLICLVFGTLELHIQLLEYPIPALHCPSVTKNSDISGTKIGIRWCQNDGGKNSEEILQKIRKCPKSNKCLNCKFWGWLGFSKSHGTPYMWYMSNTKISKI